MDKIYFHLPGFYHHYGFNLLFIEYFRNNKEKFYDNIEIGSVFDSFPGCIWDGGRIFGEELENNLVLHPLKIKQVITEFNNMNIPCRFTFSNSLLEKRHLSDPLGTLILQLAYNGNNQVIVNSPLFEEYIRKNYPKYPLISSTTKVLRGIEDLQEELNKDYFLVVSDISFNNTDDLFNLNHKEKCEILLNDTCAAKCTCRQKHYLYYSEVNLREKNIEDIPKFECIHPEIKDKTFYELLKTNPSHVTVEDLYNKYVPAGFRHFKMIGRSDWDLAIAEYYLYYMVKPEYQTEVLSQLIRFIKMAGYLNESLYE